MNNSRRSLGRCSLRVMGCFDGFQHSWHREEVLEKQLRSFSKLIDLIDSHRLIFVGGIITNSTKRLHPFGQFARDFSSVAEFLNASIHGVRCSACSLGRQVKNLAIGHASTMNASTLLCSAILCLSQDVQNPIGSILRQSWFCDLRVKMHQARVAVEDFRCHIVRKVASRTIAYKLHQGRALACTTEAHRSKSGGVQATFLAEIQKKCGFCRAAMRTIVSEGSHG